MEDDWMELGETGWVPGRNGSFYNKDTKEVMDADGKITALEDEEDNLDS